MSIEQTMTLTKEIRRERIIQAAIDVLVRDGWHRTTMASIAAQAGISRGLISYHFAGSGDLYEATLASVVEAVFGEGSASIEQRISTAANATDMLRTYIAENLRYIGAHRREMTALGEIVPHLRREDGSPRFGTAEEEPIIAGTAALFEHGISTGEFRAMDARLIASALRRCIDGAAHSIVVDPQFDIEVCAAELTELFLRGVRS